MLRLYSDFEPPMYARTGKKVCVVVCKPILVLWTGTKVKN